MNDNENRSPYFDYTAFPAEELEMRAREAVPVQPEKKTEKPRQSGGGFRKAIFSAGLGLCFGLFAGAGFYGVKLGAEHFLKEEVSEVQSDAVDTQRIPAVDEADAMHVVYIHDDVSGVVEEVMPAMVSIVNNYTGIGYNIWGQRYSRSGAASGSGIIASENDSELLIVTNNHVVEGADTLEVTFTDGTTAQADIKGQDADMDLAVIAVPLDSLSTETRNAITIAKLGDSESLKLGEPVIAIGNSLGIGQSVTNGIVSALDRELTMEDGSTGVFIQTNAAINEGNSGGALLNINGEVIGINSNKIGGTYVEGMGYAIPISSASPIIADLMQRETRTKVADDKKGYMGITMSQDPMMYYMPEGVLVDDVEEGSAAQAAGITKWDIIVKFDGQKITGISDLQNVLQYYRPGDTATVTVMRQERGEYVSYDLEITLGERPAGR